MTKRPVRTIVLPDEEEIIMRLSLGDPHPSLAEKYIFRPFAKRCAGKELSGEQIVGCFLCTILRMPYAPELELFVKTQMPERYNVQAFLLLGVAAWSQFVIRDRWVQWDAKKAYNRLLTSVSPWIFNETES